MKSDHSSRYNNFDPEKDILLCSDLSHLNQYERMCQNRGISYLALVKREQRFFRTLLETKYRKTKLDLQLRVLVYSHSEFGKRTANDYKVCRLNSPDYKKFMSTDDYSDLFSLTEAVKVLLG